MWSYCVIIVIILLMLWSSSSNLQNREQMNQSYTHTTGHVLDDTAVHAIHTAKRKHKKHKTGYKRTEAGDVADNSFILGSLFNFNVEPNMPEPKKKKVKRKAAKHFNDTITTIVQNPDVVVQTAQQPAEFMIDRIEDFYDDYVLNTIRNGADVPHNNFIIPNFPAVRQVVRNARRSRSEKNAELNKHLPKKQAMQTMYYQTELPSDPQNVHDHQVVTDTQRKFRRIVQHNSEVYDPLDHKNSKDIRSVFEDINQAVNSHAFSDERRRQDAMQVLQSMHSPETIGSLGASQMEVLTEIWKRVQSPDNAQRRSVLVGSFMDALADGRENGHIVCTVGKCNRLMESLTLLDTDQQISQPAKTKEILRSEIFMKAHKIINDTLLQTPEPVVKAYQNPAVNTASAGSTDLQSQVSELENTLKQNIETHIQKDYSNTVDSATLTSLIEDAKAGV